jgi:Mrp family chromosome partitioning ATPase
MSLKKELLSSTAIVILEKKGGSGKSNLSQGVATTLRNAGYKVRVETTDESNANMVQIGLSQGPPISVRNEEGLSGLYSLLPSLKSGEYDHLVIDTAATDEDYILPKLANLERHVQATGAVLIVVRPVTTAHFTQTNAANFAEAKSPKTGLLLARIEAMGRRHSDYTHWLGTKTREAIIKVGAEEFAVGSIGPAVADNATQFGLPLEDLARAVYERAGEYETMAREFITLGHCAMVADWLADFEQNFGAALVKVVNRVRALP